MFSINKKQSLYIFATLIALSLGLQLSAQPFPRPIPPVDFKQSSLCQQQCSNGTLSLTFMTHGSLSGTRACPERPSTSISCAPYACQPNGSQCLTSCSGNQDCSAGYFCNPQAQQCMPLAYYCADQYRVSGTDGSNYDCVPFVCQAGRCKEACGTSNDCQGGFVCDIQHRTCVRP